MPPWRPVVLIKEIPCGLWKCRICVNAHVQRSIWARQDGETRSKKNTGTVENTDSFHILHYSICPSGRWHKPGIQGYVIKHHFWNKVNHLTRYQIHLLSCKGEHTNPSQGSACRGPARTVPLRQSCNTKFNYESRKALPPLPSTAMDSDNWTSSRHCPAEQESCRRGHLESEPQKEGYSEHWKSDCSF